VARLWRVEWSRTMAQLRQGKVYLERDREG